MAEPNAFLMRPPAFKKKHVRNILSLGVVVFFLVIAIGSEEETFIQDLLVIDGNSIGFTTEESTGAEVLGPAQATLSIYPNPAQSFVSLSSSPTVLENCRVQVLDMQGRLCLDEKEARPGPGNKEIVLDISRLEGGTYICRLLLESGKTHSSGMLLVVE